MREVTETLARELAHPTDMTPEWSESGWLLARAVASIHGVSPVLASSLRWQGPLGWQNFLHDQRAHTKTRHARTQELLSRLDDAGRCAGIAMVALKGAALYQLGIYEAGDRPMADIDLLVRDQDLRRTGRMLESLGFDLTHSNSRHEAYAAGDHAPGDLGEHSANALKLELHSHVQEKLPVRSTQITACIFPDEAQPGLNAYPSRAALLLHLLLHASGAMAFRAARLIQLHDIARLSATLGAQDWDELLAMETRLEQNLWWSFPILEMVNRYYGCIPKNVLAAASARCPWWLQQIYTRRSLSDVSLSYLWVTALPGIEWSRSPYDALRYVKQRLVPDSKLLDLRKVQTQIQPWAAHSNWSHLSQGKRLLRWIVTRPARPESLYPIQIALSQPR